MSNSQPCVTDRVGAPHYLSTSPSVSVLVATAIVAVAREFIIAIVVLGPVGRWRPAQPSGCNFVLRNCIFRRFSLQGPHLPTGPQKSAEKSAGTCRGTRSGPRAILDAATIITTIGIVRAVRQVYPNATPWYNL